MSAFIAIALTLVAVAAVVVVMTDDPARQAVSLSVYGVLLAVLFMALTAPDVALSQIGVGTAIVPLMVMLAIRKMRDRS
ncbi:MAG TPA: DUF4040 domain-containing protein [Mycobacteriales bacterium]|nr:DUF4040 domain-containing protein [Mycobacteriales bacterium]